MHTPMADKCQWGDARYRGKGRSQSQAWYGPLGAKNYETLAHEKGAPLYHEKLKIVMGGP